MSKTGSRFQTARKWLIFWTLFIGLGAVAGASGMILDPSGKAMGMDAMLPFFRVLPFSDILFKDFLFSGFALLIVNGLTNLTAAGFLFANKKAGVVLGGIFGVTLMLWICIQFYMFPANFMSTVYFIFGLCQAITGYAAWVFRQQEDFRINESDYPEIGKNPHRLVVCFSRMGYTKKAALEEANRTGAELLELKTSEKTEGTSGFWWCGRFGMCRMEMPLRPVEKDLSLYGHVTICTPVWVFSLASPVRTFCREARGKIREADLISVHFTKGRNERVLHEAESLLHLSMTDYRSICCRFGRQISP